jgi:two-component system, chemotaxis family, protein-glutamate methylesterase/glutaminase
MDKKKVMIVDDSSVMRLTIRNMLSKNENIVVAGALSNGKEALDKLADLQPDLILLDIEMPEMDGLEFLRHARLKTKAKVIILSSLAGTDSPRIAEAQMLGADAIMAKPSGSVSADLEEKSGAEFWGAVKGQLGL